ncbi:MAG: sigma-70 family RNA polymerase sigma factor [Deltaproteobacteria bacterium]|nr:sigma-70 family RNA polymerase sigma factor [Deltaproteobacteria bacterium]
MPHSPSTDDDLLLGDRSLLDAFRRGDAQALTKIYYHHVDDVARLVRRGFVLDAQGGARVFGAPNADVERELVQETFLRAFSPAGRRAFDGLRPYRPYLLRIAKNLLIDRHRRRRPEVSLENWPEGAALDAAPLGPELEQSMDDRKLFEVTKVYLQALPAEEREIVRLRFEEGLSQDVVSAQLGVTRRRVRSVEESVQRGLERHLSSQGLYP